MKFHRIRESAWCRHTNCIPCFVWCHFTQITIQRRPIECRSEYSIFIQINGNLQHYWSTFNTIVCIVKPDFFFNWFRIFFHGNFSFFEKSSVRNDHSKGTNFHNESIAWKESIFRQRKKKPIQSFHQTISTLIQSIYSLNFRLNKIIICSFKSRF